MLDTNHLWFCWESRTIWGDCSCLRRCENGDRGIGLFLNYRKPCDVCGRDHDDEEDNEDLIRTLLADPKYGGVAVMAVFRFAELAGLCMGVFFVFFTARHDYIV
jgi:hypothetical protein